MKDENAMKIKATRATRFHPSAFILVLTDDFPRDSTYGGDKLVVDCSAPSDLGSGSAGAVAVRLK
jgi:hypothetical protein